MPGACGAPPPDQALRQLPVLATLLTPILGSRAAGQARVLLERFGSVAGIQHASFDALHAALGEDGSAAAALLAARELMHLGAHENLMAAKVIVGHPQLSAFLVSELQHPSEERLLAIYLDEGDHSIRSEQIGIGTRNGIALRTRFLVHRALELNASKLILAHNHPSGSLRPSDSDQRATAVIERIGRDLGIELVDHCIVARGRVFSMRQGRELA